jgi:hypothetical protein
MKFYKSIFFSGREKRVVLEAGWYPGENWTVLQCDILKFMPEIGYVVILYLQIGKAAVSVAIDEGRV